MIIKMTRGFDTREHDMKAQNDLLSLMSPIKMASGMDCFTLSCHCGAVQGKVGLSGEPVLHACNCSMCNKTAFLHLIVKSEHFQLLSEPDAITEYRFNTGVARHWFCRRCGVKAFYRPRSHPEGVSVNGRCLDGESWHDWPIKDFDGQNWEQSIERIV